MLLTLGLFLASPRAHAARSPARRAAHCGAATRGHGHAASVRQTHRPRRCRHAATRHRAAHHRATKHHGTARHKASKHRTGRSHLAGPDGICQDAELRPSEENLDRIRAATLCLVNRERAANGERALQPNAALRQSAQGHTDSMVGADYFEHNGPGGLTLLARLRDAGYIYSSRIGYAIGENIGWGGAQLGTPKAIVAAWMASPGHRANILDPRYRDTAIGVSERLPSSVAHGQRGGIYTQDFGVIITA
ncbi:MAG TPA: CAP domain-containing protein [Solirubrobacteraceae bacterium]